MPPALPYHNTSELFPANLPVALCKPVAKIITLRKDGCEVDVVSNHCKGHCTSETRFNGVTNIIETHCSCCIPKKSTKMTARAICKNGKTVQIKYTLFQKCECSYKPCDHIY
ncbi:integumentary mucin B.1-like [Leucoraja erinacea]|uniref:integumentary mucin B.1-like n=1 Tax=Leucoraja erinaceus TaxID=7782 RepID=UPI002453AD82|nr:integumentary mucin B.1-like [Leucoraja erinacea]